MSGKGSAAASKALKASKAARIGVSKKKTVVRTKVHFYRPTTKLGGAQVQSYMRSLPAAVKEPRTQIVKKPLTSDAAMKQIEDNNTLVFLVAPTASRTQIKAAVQKVRMGSAPAWGGAARARRGAAPPAPPHSPHDFPLR